MLRIKHLEHTYCMLQKGFVSPLLIIILVVLFFIIVSGFYFGLGYFFPRNAVSINKNAEVQESTSAAYFEPINSTKGDIPMQRSSLLSEGNIGTDDVLVQTSQPSTMPVNNSVKVQKTANNMRSISFKKVEWSEEWHDFTVYFDESWTIERAEQSKDDLYFDIIKGNSSLTIFQGATHGGICNSPGDPPLNEAGSDFLNKAEIRKGELVWRLSELAAKYESPNSYEVCEAQNINSNFFNTTSIGPIMAKIDSTQKNDLAEIVEILKRIEIK